jgi:hypothetical protein
MKKRPAGRIGVIVAALFATAALAAPGDEQAVLTRTETAYADMNDALGA